MYPNLRYAFYDLFGIDIPAFGLIQSFGLCLALAFIVAGYVLMQDLKRREQIGLMQGIEEKVLKGALPKVTDYITALLTGFLIGFKGVYALFNSGAFTGCISPEMIKQEFGREDLYVFTDSNLMVAKLKNEDWTKKNLLLMSSGNFHGVDFQDLSNQLI